MRYLLAAIAATLLITSAGRPQACAPPPIVVNAKSDNMFSPEQETWLGEAFLDNVQKDYRVIDDQALTAYLQAIGERVAKHLPVSGLKFHFVIVDVPDTNAYTFPGGTIMITRKMISFARNEDELAAVIGHELGHATVHHSAIDWTKTFKQVLGITSLTDRKSVFNAYHRYLEAYRTKRSGSSADHENDQQLQADKIGVYAVYAAGYDPNAMTAFWKRLTNAKKVGALSALFGDKRPEDKRLEEMINAVKSIPAQCIDKPSGTRASFDSWKNNVIGYSGLGEREELSGLVYKRPLQPLRSDIQYLHFSPDGNYILAQDSSTVTVLSREPLSVLFRVDVEDAFPAKFSIDSKQLIVYNANLRVQKWSIADQKLVSTQEITLPGGGYWQSQISPDGNYIACYKYNADLVVYDVASGEEVFKKTEFYRPTYFEVLVWELLMDLRGTDEAPVMNMEFSPDGKYFLAGHRSGAKSFIVGGGYQEDEAIAVDLATKKKISIGDNIKKLLLTSMDFIGPDKVIGQYGMEPKKSGVFSFPSGDRLSTFDLTGKTFGAAYQGNLVAVRPVVGAAVGLFDMAQNKFLLGNAKSALDVYGRTFVAEKRDGELGLFNADTRENFASIALPPSPFGSLRTAELSGDGNWLAVSDRSRGSAWDLTTGERKIYIRAFKGAYITPDAKVYSDFPKQGKTERSIAVMDLKGSTVATLGEMKIPANIRQFGPYLVVRKPLHEKPEKPESEEDKKKQPYSEETPEKPIPQKEVLLEMRDVRTGQLLWKREFPDERPALAIDTAQDTMILGWSLSSTAASEIIKNDPALKAKKDKMGAKEGDQLIEFVDPKTGTVKGHFLLETGERSFRPDYVTLAGDNVLVNDNHNRILLYSASTGESIAKFFGSYAVLSPTTKQVAIENSPGRVLIADVSSGRELGRLRFAHKISLMQYLDSGRRLFVLTSDQTAFMFDTAKFQAEEPIAEKR